MTPANQESPRIDLIDLRELARIYRRYRWSVAGMGALAAAVAALIATNMEPIYRAGATILIEAKSQQIVQIPDFYDPGYGTVEYYLTQHEILRSREMAASTVDRLGLVDRRELISRSLAGEVGESALDWHKFLPFLPVDDSPKLSDAEAREQLRDRVIREFMEHLSIDRIPFTQLVKVNFDAASAELAAEVPNTLAELFIEGGMQARLEATRKATVFLTDKLEGIRKQLADSEAALQAFRDREKIVDIGGARGLREEEVLDYSRRLREAEKLRGELENTYRQVRQAGSNPERLRDISVLLIDPLVQKASASLLDAEEALRQLQERYGPRHPELARASARRDSARAAFNEQLRIAAEGIRSELVIAQQNEDTLRRQLAQASAEVQRIDNKSYELSVLEREVTTNQQLYDTFLTRFKEADSASNYDALSARVVDPAVTPIKPSEPKIRQIVLFAGLGGLLAGILLVLLRQLMGDEIHGVEEIEQLSGLPVLGVLPLVRTLGRPRSLARYYVEHGSSPYSEGVRSIRAGIQLVDSDKRPQCIMVTSSVPAEGKSSVASSLALSLAGMERVLLVDADLRRPTLSGLLDRKPAAAKAGLAEVLSGGAALDDALTAHASGITVLPSGIRVTNPAELLASGAFAALIEELRPRFDRIIFDTPPCRAASDALLIGKHLDAALFVVRADVTSRAAIRRALKQLDLAHIRVIGHIVNQLDARKNRYYSEYYYGYG